MADSTDSAPPPNVPSRHGSLRPSNNSSGHGLLVQQDSITGKGGAGKKKDKDNKKSSKLGVCFEKPIDHFLI